MALDLETMKTEILEVLNELGMPVFYGYSGLSDAAVQVYWDTDQHPDFREFLLAGKASGTKLMVFHHQPFSLDQIDEALEELDDSELPREEKRKFENRLRELQPYEGFTCSLELSFSIDGRIHIYQRQTEWYLSLDDILAELEAVTAVEEDEDQGPIGGYFSNN